MKAKIYIMLLLIGFCSCKKDWLEKKRDISIIIPTTLKDMRLLLNNDLPLNYDTRSFVENSADEFTVTKQQYDAYTNVAQKNAVLWKKDIYEGTIKIADWNEAYRAILYTNVILEGLAKLTRNTENAAEYDYLKGNALFFRSKAFLNLVMTFSLGYNPKTANSDLGIPLKLSADITEKISRVTVSEVYSRIILDLSEATNLLSVQSFISTDANKVVAYGLLARTYLYMQKYDLALKAADECYKLKSDLIDFNLLDPNIARPIAANSVEVHSFSNMTPTTTQSTGNANIDEVLYNLYDSNDLRKIIYYTRRTDGGLQFRAHYTGNTMGYGSTATDEILLIRAECKARTNDVSGSMDDLNKLLIKRYKTGTYIPMVASTGNDALAKVLNERRKELVRRGLRFEDLKRLNQDPQFARTLSRTVDGISYSLPPNDPRYALPIPPDVIEQNNFEQNPR